MTWESKAGVRDETKNATGVEIASRKLVRTVSKVDVAAHLSELEVIRDVLSNNEANTQELERVKIGSNKICFREDLAKEKMVFSKESSRAVFEMGNVKLIELKSSIQCPSCLHYVLEGTLLCKWSNLMRPGQDVMNWIKEPFEILNTIPPHIYGCHKRQKMRSEPVAATSPQGSRRIAECYKR